MSITMFHAIEFASGQIINPARHSLTFARADAEAHFAKTGQHCGVCKVQMVWMTSFLSDLPIGGGLDN